MPRPKSILQNATVDIAGKSHDCQHVASHRILKGDKRLKVKKNRSNEYFCIGCALKILESDICKLQELKRQLTE